MPDPTSRRRAWWCLVTLAVLTTASGCTLVRPTPAPTLADGRYDDPLVKLRVGFSPGWHALPPQTCEDLEKKFPGMLCRLLAVRIDQRGPESIPVVMVLAEKLPIPTLDADEYLSTQKPFESE